MLGYTRPVAESFALAGGWQPTNVSLTPTSSRAATPMPDLSTPRKNRQPADSASVAHVRTESTSTTRSAASAESSSLFASLVESFPPPPPNPAVNLPAMCDQFKADLSGDGDDDDDDDDDGDDALRELEEVLSLYERGGWFDMPAPATGPSSPPPPIPLPPLPAHSTHREEDMRLRVFGLGLPTTYEPPLGAARAHSQRPALKSPSPASVRVASGPPCPPPPIPLPSLPTMPSSPPIPAVSESRDRESMDWSIIDWTASCAGTGELDPQSVPLSPTCTDVSRLGTFERPHSLEKHAFGATQQARPVATAQDEERRAASPHQHSALSTSSTSRRSSLELDTITADLSDLLASFQQSPSRLPTAGPTMPERARRSRAASGQTTDPDEGAMERLASPPEQRLHLASRKLSAMSTYSVASSSSTTSSQANTTGGYKAYKLVRKQPSFAFPSPSSSRRGSVATGHLATDSDASSSDSEELFDLAFDSTAPPKPGAVRRNFTPRKRWNGGRRNGVDFRQEQYRTFSVDVDSNVSPAAAAVEDGGSLRKTKSSQLLGSPLIAPLRPRVEPRLRSVQSANALASLRRPQRLELHSTHQVDSRKWSAPLSPVHEPGTSDAGTSPVKPAPIKSLVTASTAHSSYLPRLSANTSSALSIATPPRASLLPRLPATSTRSRALTAIPTPAKPRRSATGSPRFADSQLHARKRSTLAGLSYRISAVTVE